VVTNLPFMVVVMAQTKHFIAGENFDDHAQIE
jgi:hypothetical protein